MRINGFSRPVNRYQVLSRIGFVFTGGVFVALFGANWQDLLCEGMLAGNCLGCGVVMVAGVITTGIDPTDRAVKNAREPGKFPLDGSAHHYPKYCVLCRSHTEQRSRHCHACNRCTSQFDHHCVWLNNCIGRANYPWFLLLVTSLEALAVLQLYAGLYAMKAMFTSNPSTALLHAYDMGDHGYCFFGLISIATAIAVTVAVSNGFLLCFHVYISMKGMTTIEYVHYARRKKAKVQPRIGDLNGSSVSVTSQVFPQISDSSVAPNNCGDTTKDWMPGPKSKGTQYTREGDNRDVN